MRSTDSGHPTRAGSQSSGQRPSGTSSNHHRPALRPGKDFGRHIELPEERWNDYAGLVDPDGVGPRLFFQRVPEGKSAKNRVHLDLNIGATVSDPEQRRSVVRQRSEQLADAGGSVLREVDEPTGWCVVMADPEGNEFCLLSGAVHEL